MLVGKLRADERSATAFGRDELAALRAHPSAPLDAFDLPLAEQLALVEACDVFLAPHTGFGMAALAVGTPWLALSGGRWFEYFFNHVPFRSVIPDPARYGGFTQFAEPPRVDDDGPRIPAMTEARVREDRDRIAAAAHELDRRPRELRGLPARPLRRAARRARRGRRGDLVDRRRPPRVRGGIAPATG